MYNDVYDMCTTESGAVPDEGAAPRTRKKKNSCVRPRPHCARPSKWATPLPRSIANLALTVSPPMAGFCRFMQIHRQWLAFAWLLQIQCIGKW